MEVFWDADETRAMGNSGCDVSDRSICRKKQGGDMMRKLKWSLRGAVMLLLAEDC